MGLFKKVFGNKKTAAPPPPKEPAKPPPSGGPRADTASPKDVVRHVFAQLARGQSRLSVLQDLRERGFTRKSAEGYIDMVEKTLFKGGR